MNVDDELQAHAELAAEVAVFKDVAAPYCGAFVEQNPPPVPPRPAKRVDNLIGVHTEAAKLGTAPLAARKADTADANNAEIEHGILLPPSTPMR